MNRATLEKIQDTLITVDGLSKMLALKGSVSFNLSYSIPNEGREHFISTSVSLKRIKPILVSYHKQLKQELKDLGFEENKQ